MDLNDSDLKGRRLAHYMWSELEKIARAEGSNGAVGAGGAPSGELEGGIQREVEGDEEASPSHGIVAARVEQLDDKKARGTPVIQPPPGYVYAPELQAFVPDQNNPGWMRAEQVGEAAKAHEYFQQGQQAAMQQQAQQQVDGQAEAAAQQAQMDAQQQAQEQAQQPAAQPQQPAPQQAPAQDPMSQSPAPGSKPPAGKGVVIKIGK